MMLSRPSYSATSATLLTLMAMSSLYAIAEANTHMVGPPVKFSMPAKRGLPIYSGCYSSSSGLQESAEWTWQSSGWCQQNCAKTNSEVIGLTNGKYCWCGDSVPPASSKVDDSKCSTACSGYDVEQCGANNFWTVYTIGDDPVANSGSSSSTTTSSTARVITSTAPGQTVIVTLETTADPKKSSGGTNTAGVAAGIVVGIVGAAALCGGLYFFLRRRKQRLAEEEYRRNNQMSEFMRGASEIKTPPSTYSSTSDSRLDPVTNRRDSSGSLADEQDYSRRILRVANPDR